MASRAFSAAALFLTLLVGCKSPAAEQQPSGLFHLPAAQIVLAEMQAGTLLAFEAGTGTTRWTYRPPFTQDNVVQMRGPKLLCPPSSTADGQILLRYNHGVRSISADQGVERWVKHCTDNCPPLCAASTPDNGALMLAERGRRLDKIGPMGERAWSIELPGVEPAVAAPQVASQSGDIVLRTRSTVIGLTAAGQASWVRPIQSF